MRLLVFAVLVAWWIYGALLVVGSVGKPRTPTTHSTAVASLIFVALQITGLWWLAWGSR